MAWRDLGSRLAVAGFGIPIALFLVYLGGWFLAGVIAVIAALAVREFYGLSRASGAKPFSWLGMPSASALQ